VIALGSWPSKLNWDHHRFSTIGPVLQLASSSTPQSGGPDDT